MNVQMWEKGECMVDARDKRQQKIYKNRAYKTMLQKNVSEDIRQRRRSEYKSWNRKVKDLVNESKRKLDEEFGRKLSEKFFENKKLFWKEVKRERGGMGE